MYHVSRIQHSQAFPQGGGAVGLCLGTLVCADVTQFHRHSRATAAGTLLEATSLERTALPLVPGGQGAREGTALPGSFKFLPSSCSPSLSLSLLLSFPPQRLINQNAY